jgi:hypothetical protein
MNMLVSAAAMVAATPVAADIAEERSDWSPILARAEEVVRVLSGEYVVCDGWKMDEAGAETVLAYCRSRAAGGPEDDAAEGVMIRFIVDHGQSLDWVLCGDLRGTICRAASH